MDKSILKYRRLVAECDSMYKRLYNIHRRYMTCKRGCCDCCVNLNVFPVEFYSILDAVNRANLEPNFDTDASCGFLRGDGSCAIYKYRPVICRTHGLPIAFKSDQDDDGEFSVSFCEYNFTGIDTDYHFNKFNTLNIDRLNEKLLAVNIEFIKNNPELGLDITSRIELKNLLSFA